MSKMIKALALSVLAYCGAASAQEWTYLSANAVSKGQRFPGTFVLTQATPGQYTAKFVMPDAGACLRDEMDATSIVEGANQIIEVHPRMAGCETLRLVVKTDGSGGRREVKRSDGTWRWDGMDRGLVRKAP